MTSTTASDPNQPPPGGCGEVPDTNSNWEIKEQADDSNEIAWEVPPKAISQSCFDALAEQKREELRMIYAAETLPEGAVKIGDIEMKEEDGTTIFRIVHDQ